MSYDTQQRFIYLCEEITKNEFIEWMKDDATKKDLEIMARYSDDNDLSDYELDLSWSKKKLINYLSDLSKSKIWDTIENGLYEHIIEE